MLQIKCNCSKFLKRTLLRFANGAQTIQEFENMLGKYYNPEQQDYLTERLEADPRLLKEVGDLLGWNDLGLL